MKRYKILTATTKMPANCWGKYGKIAVAEVDPDHIGPIKMISDRARGVVRIVQVWDKLHMGSTSRSAFGRAMVEAESLIRELA